MNRHKNTVFENVIQCNAHNLRIELVLSLRSLIHTVGTYHELKATRVCIHLESTTVAPQGGMDGEG